MTDFTKVRAKSYEDFCFYIVDDKLVFIPLGQGHYELSAFKINNATVNLLERAVKAMRERLDTRPRSQYTYSDHNPTGQQGIDLASEI